MSQCTLHLVCPCLTARITVDFCQVKTAYDPEIYKKKILSLLYTSRIQNAHASMTH